MANQRRPRRPVQFRPTLAAVGATFLLLGVAGGMAARPEMPADCVSAQEALAAQAHSLLINADPRTPWTLGYVVASAKLARGFCLGRHPERGLRLYGRVADEIGSRLPQEFARHEDDLAAR